MSFGDQTQETLRTGALSVRSCLICISRGSPPAVNIAPESGVTWSIATTPTQKVSATYLPRSAFPPGGQRTLLARPLTLALGDETQVPSDEAEIAAANAAVVTIDPTGDLVTVTTSIVGVPGLFMMEDDDRIVITSDIHLLRRVCSDRLRFNPAGVLDLGQYGFPVNHRTLFSGVMLLPGGSRFQYDGRATITRSAIWKLPETDKLADWDEYTDLQKEVFKSAVSRLPTERAILSLTAGLDTRAILAACTARGAPLLACTLSGRTDTLDARTAKALCRAYGIPHQTVALDDNFLRDLPDLVTEASLLSGGLASLSQAHQIYLYRQLHPHPVGRISGNMGNQLGRKGVEGVSMRAADLSILATDLRSMATSRPRSAWAPENIDGQQTHSYEFLFQQEFPFTQVSNYSIGNHFATQYSPYSNRDLMDLCARQPVSTDSGAQPSPLRLRLRDLRHRFLGQPSRYSFQRKLISDTGGPVATYPINWGWRADGRISISGWALGLGALVDAYTDSRGWDSGPTKALLTSLHISGLHEHRKPHLWMDMHLRDFVHDTLTSAKARDSGLFDNLRLQQVLASHYGGRSHHYKALGYALDLALAANNFNAQR